MKSIIPFTFIAAVVLTGLSAGLFYAWQVSVIPGTKKVTDMVYLETMQSINKAILNPAFFLSFIGCLIPLCIGIVQQYGTGKTFVFILLATIIYLIGTFAVTIFGNVPLNEALDVLDLSDLAEGKATIFRQDYEKRWNRFHLIRTAFSVLSFVFSVLALYSFSNQS